jgi:hypothetical protein
MAVWLGSKKIVFIPMIRPTDPVDQRNEVAINAEVFRRILFNPSENNRTFSEHVNRSSHGRASVDPIFLPARQVPWTDLAYGSTTPTPSENGVNYALDEARKIVSGTPGVDYFVCSIGQGNDSAPGYTGVGGVGGTAIPAKGWFRTHVQAAVGEYMHEALHVITLLQHYYTTNPNVAEYDPMASTNGAHPTVFTKRLIGWMPSEEIARHPRSGQKSYWLRHQGIFAPGSIALGYAAVTVVDRGSTYYIESRYPVDQFESIISPARQGVIIYKVETEDGDPGAMIAPILKLVTPRPLQQGVRITLDGDIKVEVINTTPQSVQVSIIARSEPITCQEVRNKISRLQRTIDDIERTPETPEREKELIRQYARLEKLEQQLVDLGCLGES